MVTTTRNQISIFVPVILFSHSLDRSLGWGVGLGVATRPKTGYRTHLACHWPVSFLEGAAGRQKTPR